ncbi:MAG: bifunctional hydroxymethylpyrimidine kinase/phosphomethylpyrimidine kinase [Bacteroidales bacterium]|nr:bifunctional hydroxymethylpyrimidine kinase/phosphomethylpyrimidine kinase [Bacteroidales bacterium]
MDTLNKMRYKLVMSIAGTDPTSGAGIQADLKTAAALGCYATNVITAVVVQNTQGVREVMPMSASMIEAQVRAILDDTGTDTVKIGMLCGKEQIMTVAKLLKEYKLANVVLDPVLASTSGATFLKRDGLKMLCDELMPYVRLVTPNIPEAMQILGIEGEDIEMEEVAKVLVERCKTSILLKGGHKKGAMERGQTSDMLCDAERRGEIYAYTHEYIDTPNTHGTGCTLSTAIASYMAIEKGRQLSEIVGKAHDYVASAIKGAARYEIGEGHGPLHHFWELWK